MGVRFLVCTACQRTFPDCCDCYQCKGCCARYCSADCAQLDGEDYSEDEDGDEVENEDQTCIDCREELPSSENLLHFALEKLNMRLEDLKAEYLAKE